MTQADYDYNYPTKSWALDRLDQEELPLDGFYDPPEEAQGGKNVHVYIVDTGIRKTHQEFEDRVGEGVDFVDLDFEPQDCNGHGTHCAGVCHIATSKGELGLSVCPITRLHIPENRGLPPPENEKRFPFQSPSNSVVLRC